MTSNIGAETIRKGSAIGFASRADETKIQEMEYEKMKEKLLEELKKTFRPEFLNRIDSVMVFHSLNKEHIRKIVDLMLANVIQQLKEKGMKLEITDLAKDYLGEKGYDEAFGARPLRRVIQDMIEDKLSDSLLRGQFRPGDTVIVDVEEEEIVVHTDAVEALMGDIAP
jgi:ATP-dependent Clp protease ATP-binding subunit ClpC